MDARRDDDEPELRLGNEFAEVVVKKVRTRNGVRLAIQAPRLGRQVRLCPLELEALTWQTSEVFSGFLATPFGPELEAEED
ncbi:MAG: dihydrodiol dehydrogenase [Nitriliruptorales bacterium]|nr:dihydrodiol dehydrogenase [Nitriliruptorales bacterium]